MEAELLEQKEKLVLQEKLLGLASSQRKVFDNEQNVKRDNFENHWKNVLNSKQLKWDKEQLHLQRVIQKLQSDLMFE